jgi:hypothetical protein
MYRDVILRELFFVSNLSTCNNLQYYYFVYLNPFILIPEFSIFDSKFRN